VHFDAVRKLPVMRAKDGHLSAAERTHEHSKRADCDSLSLEGEGKGEGGLPPPSLLTATIGVGVGVGIGIGIDWKHEPSPAWWILDVPDEQGGHNRKR
jgi:hypothetical protein